MTGIDSTRPNSAPATRTPARLLAGVSLSAAALSLALGPQPAQAQAVNGTPTVVFGADAPTRSAAQDSFNVTANDALIDWDVTDPSVFLNANTSLNFARDGGAYSVLNRVVSSPSLTSTLAINGAVNASGGKIFFYNPGGWVVGGGAVFDVGSLLLTASPVLIDDKAADGQKFTNAAGTISLGQATVPGASITVNQGALLSTLAQDSYIALVAPRVVQGGTVSSGGSVAYVGAEAADLTMNNGLFDINVTVGTTDQNGVVHTGTTTSSVADTAPHGQYLVAVPKNDALTMLVSGNLGYNAASSAGLVDGRIVLSSGHSVVGGQPDATTPVPGGNIAISNAVFNGDTRAVASDSIALTVKDPSQSVTTVGNLSLEAGNAVGISVDGTESSLTVTGNLGVTATNGPKGGKIDATISNGGNLFVGGTFDAHADGFGRLALDPETQNLDPAVLGEDASGGSVAVTIDKATANIGGNVSMSADARGGIGGLGAGAADAGSVSLVSRGDGPTLSFSPTATLSLSANADRANYQGQQFYFPDNGAASQAGSVTLDISGGASFGSAQLSAFSAASFGNDVNPHNADAGIIDAAFRNGTYNIGVISSSTAAYAENGGAAKGGTQSLTVDNATLTLANYLDSSSYLQGSSDGTGLISVSSINGGLLDSPSIYLSSYANSPGSGVSKPSGIAITADGGAISTGYLSAYSSGRGSFDAPDAKGGAIDVNISNGGSLFGGSIYLQSTGFGSFGQDGGVGTGGDITVNIGDGSFTTGGYLSIGAEGYAGSPSAPGGLNGLGQGGKITISLTDPAAKFASDYVSIYAPGYGGSGGGEVAVEALTTLPGAGGDGTGGTVSFNANAGTVTASQMYLSALGQGGDGFNTSDNLASGVGGKGGTGTGGTVTFTQSGGSASIATLDLQSDGYGGAGADSFGPDDAPAGDGGDGKGGTASVSLTGGTLAANTVNVIANGNYGSYFGYSGNGGRVFTGPPTQAGQGGNGEGGTASLTIDGGILADLVDTADSSGFNTALSVVVDADAYGGNGGDTYGSVDGPVLGRGNGGSAKGGSATFALISGSADASNISVSADGYGGLGGIDANELGASASTAGNGGAGAGGAAQLTIGTDFAAMTTDGSSRSISVSAEGSGASGADGLIGGLGGDASGGSAAIDVTGGKVALNDVFLSVYAGAGRGGASGADNTGAVGGSANAGTASVSVANGAVLTLTGSQINAGATGGSGGRGGSGDGVADISGKGGSGGSATGGTAIIGAQSGGTLTLVPGEGSLQLSVDGIGGSGGDGGSSVLFGGTTFGDGGDGAAGTGGAITFAADGGTINAGSASFSAVGYGGYGGARPSFDTSATDASNGGSGGAGTGGAITLGSSLAGGALNFNRLSADASGYGGIGAGGSGFDATTLTGASGGAGGTGTGGRVTLSSASGASTIVNNDLTLLMIAYGYGGGAGAGATGGVDIETGAGGAGGTGGAGGSGFGGDISITAPGGLVRTNNASLYGNGYAAGGGLGGSGGVGQTTGAAGTSGTAGSAQGGNVLISASPAAGFQGGLDLGEVSIDVTSAVSDQSIFTRGPAGSVTISDTVDENNGGVKFVSLLVDATDPGTGVPLVSISSIDQPIRIANDANVQSGGDILVTATGTGGLAVGGMLALTADRDIAIRSIAGGLVSASDIFLSSGRATSVSSENCSDPLCLTVAATGALSVNAGTSFDLVGPAQIRGVGSIDVRGETEITGGAGSGYISDGDIVLTSGGDVTVRNASGRFLDFEAGQHFVFVPQTESFSVVFDGGTLTLGEAAGGGTIAASDGLLGLAGNDIVVTPGASLSTGFGLQLTAGDDILIGPAAALAANLLAGALPQALSLDAGGLVTQTPPAIGDIASLIVGNRARIDGGSGPVQIVANAIDARGATFAGGDFLADVRNAPAPGATQGDDGGQLSAACLEGDICIGSALFSGSVQIGQGKSVPVHFTGLGNITGTSIAITARDGLIYGLAATPVSLSATGPVTLVSQAGDVSLVGNALVSGGTVDISAAGSVVGNGRIVSSGDVGISVGANITADSITAGRQLTSFGQTGGILEPVFAVPGNFTVNSLRLGADGVIAGGGDIVVGFADFAGSNLDFTAQGLVSLGSTGSIGNLALTGDRASFGTIGASGNIQIKATNAIAGTSATAGGSLLFTGATIDAASLQSGTGMTLASGGATTLGSATAGTTLSINAGSIIAGSLRSGANMTLSSAGAVALGSATSGAGLAIQAGPLSFASLTSTGNTSVNATSVAGGDVAAGGSVQVTAANALVLGTVTSGAALGLQGASIAAGALHSTGPATILSPGAVSLTTVDAGTNLTVGAGALRFDRLGSGQATAIDAASVAGGDIAAGSSLRVTSPGGITLGTATAGTTLALDGATIAATSLRSGGAMSLTSSGATSLGTANSGAGLTITSGALDFTSLTSTGNTQITSASVAGGDIAAGGNLQVTATNALQLGAATAGGTLALQGTTIAASALRSTGAMSLTSGGSTTLGTANSGADLTIASGPFSFASLTSTGNTKVDSSSVSGGDIAAGGNVQVTATNGLQVGAATAGGALSLQGATITAGPLRSAGATALSSTGAAALGMVDAGTGLTITSGDLSFTRLASGQEATIDAANVAGGDVAAGTSLRITTPGTLSLGTATAGTTLALDGASIAATTLQSGGAMTLASSGATTLGSATSGAGLTVNAGSLGFAALRGAGDVAITAGSVSGGDVTSTGGSVNLASTGPATVGTVSAANDVTARATTLAFGAINAGLSTVIDVTTLNGTAITTGQDLTIRSFNSLSFGSLAAGRNLSLNASSGAITISTDLDAGGLISLIADAILVKASGPLNVNTAIADNGDIGIVTDGALQVGLAQAIGDISLRSTAGSLTLGTARAGYSPATPAAINEGGTSQGTPGPGDITLAAATSATLLDTVDAKGRLDLTAATIDQRGLAVGKVIAYGSGDIALGANALLGQSSYTSAITLSNTGTAGAVLGTTSSTAAGYRLDSAEFGRIHSGGDFTVNGGSSLTVGTLGAVASGGTTDGAIGATGTLALRTTGSANIGGALSLANAGGNTLVVSAGSDIVIDGATGSIALAEGSGHGGTLQLGAARVIAASSAALPSIGSLTGSALDARLATVDTGLAGRTLLDAGNMAVTISGGFYVQNTGGMTFDTRRGFAADALSIKTGSTPADIVINGTIAGQGGLTALRATSITGTYTDFSTINGCRIAANSCGTITFDPLRELLDEEIFTDGALGEIGVNLLLGRLITINRVAPPGFETVIDEPVTGAGNEDLLSGSGSSDDNCPADDRTKCDKPPSDGAKPGS
ncbi:hypothetical protein ACFO0A_06720 [Novosphingobium tardum]|uniref:Filamentous haemagglutinin FhaB/tRNA nuclease CdiA-like TPS domain-containing protein n=1 Tax=Novosphingobium tardum TaxID=1538021 RepID=A0ABV8RMZ7_9SPHN